MTQLFAGLITSIIVITHCAAASVLIFSGKFRDFLPLGISMSLITTIIVNLTVSMRSAFKPVICTPIPAYAAVVAVMSMAIAGASEASDSAALLPTLIACLFVTSLLSGIVLFLLGRFSLANVVRFVPYPVIGGFVISSGWLIFTGAFRIMAVAENGDTHYFSTLNITHYLPGIALALLLFLTSRRLKQYSSFLISVMLAVVVTYAFMAITQQSTPMMIEQGWFFHDFQSQWIYPKLQRPFLEAIAWQHVLNQSAYIISAVIMVIIIILMNASSLEINFQQEVNFDSELYSLGLGNILSALCGGINAPISFTTTVLSHQTGGTSNFCGVIVAGVCLLTLFFGGALFTHIPVFLIGGILIYTACNVFNQWLYKEYFKLPHLDYAMMIAIPVMVIVLGLLPGILSGIVAASLLFLVRYSKVSAIKFILSGDQYQSKMMRSPEEEQFLQNHGYCYYVVKLQGYIFFGTANTVLVKLRTLSQFKLRALEFIIIDFRLVTGIDVSACLSLIRYNQTVHEQKIQLVFTNVAPVIEDEMRACHVLRGDTIILFDDMDKGVEWVENQLLQRFVTRRRQTTDIAESFKFFASHEYNQRFLKYLELAEFSVGSFLFRQGELADYMYFVGVGIVSVYVEDEEGRRKHLRSMGTGSIVGEMGFYLKSSRTAFVRVEESAIVYKLTRMKLREMQRDEPDIALSFQRRLIEILCERVAHNNQELAVLTY